MNLAFLSLSENQVSLAKAHYLEALEVARNAGTPSLEVKPLLGLSSLALDSHKDGQARDYYRKALQIAENIRLIDADIEDEKLYLAKLC